MVLIYIGVYPVFVFTLKFKSKSESKIQSKMPCHAEVLPLGLVKTGLRIANLGWVLNKLIIRKALYAFGFP